MARKTVNKVFLLGNLGADPELRYSADQTPVATLSIATNERYKEGEEWKDRTEWHRVVAFGRQAEIASEYLSKGNGVFIEGTLQTRSWDDEKAGIKRYTTEIKVRDLTLLGGSTEGTSTRPPHPADSNELTHTGPSETTKSEVAAEDARPIF